MQRNKKRIEEEIDNRIALIIAAEVDFVEVLDW